MDLPTVLYRCPGQWSRPGGTYDYFGVETEEAYEKAIAEGWQLTMPAAIEAYENKRNAVIAEVKAEAEASAAPSIADMQPERVRGKPGPKPKVKEAP